ncbi:MAG: hypothetical protein H7Y01_13495 [Ferruginibacter sp.]|nr:hypothetical protein [Chitinophagaceae bacterium]
MKYKFLIFFICLFLAGCKKLFDTTSYETKINFTYNGQQYTRTSPSRILTDLLFVQNEFLVVNFTGLRIEDPSLLGGNIYIDARTQGPVRCAFLSPPGTSVFAAGGNCNNLQSGNGPIDSVSVYWYESGSLNFSYSDCKAVTVAIVQGQKDCAISGTFDLSLTNKNNQKIRLTNGSFSGRIRTYP